MESLASYCHELSGRDLRRINLMYCQLDLASEKQNQNKPPSPHLHTHFSGSILVYHSQLLYLLPITHSSVRRMGVYRHSSPAPARALHSQQLLQKTSTCYGTRSSAGCHACICSSTVISILQGHACPSQQHHLLPFSSLQACRTASLCFFPHILLHLCLILSFLKQVFTEAPQTSLTAMVGSHSHEVTADPAVSGTGSPIPLPSELSLPQYPALDTQATTLQRASSAASSCPSPDKDQHYPTTKFLGGERGHSLPQSLPSSSPGHCFPGKMCGVQENRSNLWKVLRLQMKLLFLSQHRAT